MRYAWLLLLWGCTHTITETVTVTDTLTRTDTVHVAVATPQYRLALLGRGFDRPVAVQSDAGGLLIAGQAGLVVRLDGSVALDLRSQLPEDLNFVGGLQNFLVAGDRRFVYLTTTDWFGLVAEVKGAKLDTLLLTGDVNRDHFGGGLAWYKGRLLVAFGDGGTGDSRGPRLTGKVVAIDPATHAREVLASGLRNPWRMALQGDSLWIADAGDRLAEEVNVLDLRAPGADFGWGISEGDHCSVPSCAGVTLPLYSYPTGKDCSTVVGGAMYAGRFWFADYCEAWVRSVGPDGSVTHHVDLGERVVAVTALPGQLPIILTATGSLWRVVPQ